MGIFSPPARPARAARRAFAPSVAAAALETRDLMAAGSVAFVDGVLGIYGGDGASHVEVAPSATTPGNIAVDVGDGETHEFSAADVKLLFYYDSPDGQDSFVNRTDETTVAFLRAAGDSFLGGPGSSVVIDAAPGGSDVDAAGPLTYVDASRVDGSHGVSLSYTRSGGIMVRAY